MKIIKKSKKKIRIKIIKSKMISNNNRKGIIR